MQEPRELEFMFDVGTVKYSRCDESTAWHVNLIHHDNDNLNQELSLPTEHRPNIPDAMELYRDWLAPGEPES